MGKRDEGYEAEYWRLHAELQMAKDDLQWMWEGGRIIRAIDEILALVRPSHLQPSGPKR